MTAQSWNQVTRWNWPTAVALGNFDGVHLGHQAIFSELASLAQEQDFDAVAVSFHPHPRQFFHPSEPATLLTPPLEKKRLIEATGIKFLALDFNADVASLSPETFIEEFLIQRLRAERVCIGPDHRFGKGAAGDASLLRKMLREESSVRVVAPVTWNGLKVSSSEIRQALDAGDLKRVAAFLGRPYQLEGRVVHGQGRGAQLGFPTANLEIQDSAKALPRLGVYGCVAEVGTDRYWAVVNVGSAPTIRDGVVWIEAHLLGFDGDLYGSQLTLHFGPRMREEMRFSGVESLKSQVLEDINRWKSQASQEASLAEFAPARGLA